MHVYENSQVTDTSMTAGDYRIADPIPGCHLSSDRKGVQVPTQKRPMDRNATYDTWHGRANLTEDTTQTYPTRQDPLTT